MDKFIDLEGNLINVNMIGSIKKGEQNWCVDGDIQKRYTLIIYDKNNKEIYIEIFITKEERDVIYEDVKGKVME